MATVTRFGPFWLRRIDREEGPYLDRYSVREQDSQAGGGWRAYIHRFWSRDHELHNHPWRWSFSIILWGSYTEIYSDTPEDIQSWRKRRVRWFNFIPASRYHQITELHGNVWTLFVCGPLHGKGWGFWVPGRGLVKHRQRKTERGLAT